MVYAIFLFLNQIPSNMSCLLCISFLVLWMSIFAQKSKYQNEKIQPSTSKQQKCWSIQALLQLHFLDHYIEHKIIKYMWKQSLSKKTQFQTSNLHSQHQDQTPWLRSILNRLDN
jgi:hypothetical protein